MSKRRKLHPSPSDIRRKARRAAKQTNLSVSMLTEPGLTPCSSRQETPAMNGEAQGSIPDHRIVDGPTDSCGAQTPFSQLQQKEL